MAQKDVFTEYLRKLSKQPTWRVCELPAEYTEDVLRVLDGRGWIEFRRWKRVQKNLRPLQDDSKDPNDYVVKPAGRLDWFSPRKSPLWAGDLPRVLGLHSDDPKLSPELRVSEKGEQVLAELRVSKQRRKKARGKHARRKREEPTREQTEAFKLHLADKSYREIGTELGVSHSTARNWVKLAKAYWDKELRTGRSVKPSQALPTDRHDQVAIGEDEPHTSGSKGRRIKQSW